MNSLSEEKIIELNELYLKIKTYAGVSRAMGGSPSPATVKKYIIDGYVSKDNIPKKVFKKEDYNSKFSYNIFVKTDNWGELCELSLQEEEEIKELWEEILL